MLPKFFAYWLVVLVIAPFTAPFSTCELTGFIGSAHRQHAPVAPAGSAAVRTDATVPGGLFVSAVGRVRLLPLSRVSVGESAARSSSATLAWFGASAGSVRGRSVLSTVLRV
jgi:hypothetical protein